MAIRAEKDLEVVFNAVQENDKLSLEQMVRSRGLDLNQLNKQGHSPLSLAVKRVFHEIVKSLLELGAHPNFPPGDRLPLLLALKAEHLGIFLSLLQFKANPNGPTEDGSLLGLAAKKRLTSYAKHLLVAGADPNRAIYSKYSFGPTTYTPLHAAIWADNDGLVEELIKFKADVNRPDSLGRPPLLAAIGGYKQNIAMHLISSGANMEGVAPGHYLSNTAQRWNAIDEAFKYNCSLEFFVFLVGRLPNFKEPSVLGNFLCDAAQNTSPRITKFLLDSGADPNFDSGKPKGTPLNCAANSDDIESAKLLVEAGADVNDAGDILRHKLGPVDKAINAFRVRVAVYLIECGAKIDPNTFYLHHAAAYGMLELARALLYVGVNPNTPDDRGRTPLTHAMKYGRKLVIQELLEAGADPRPGYLGFDLKTPRKLSAEKRAMLGRYSTIPPLSTLCIRAVKRANLPVPDWVPSFLLLFPIESQKAIDARQKAFAVQQKRGTKRVRKRAPAQRSSNKRR